MISPRHGRTPRRGLLFQSEDDMSLLRVWLTMTAAIASGFLIWNYAPILIPFAVVTVALGAITLGIRALVQRFDKRPPPDA